ncbi:hypothetical protein ACI6PS_11545 [Flavobacterium sp. PLA-1-15]|uniref:hypothetical protein n=1 Tax=Flavobacterium sp. PLA-1-15 TaxID=3380533 RepID=UPI003B7998F4
MIKEVKFGKTPSGDKSIKVSGDPNTYKDKNVSWQFGLMDFDFEHGWNHVIDRVQFSHDIKYDIEYSLMAIDCDEELYNQICKFNTTDFVNIHAFFHRLKSIPNIKTTDILCILGILKKNFFWHELYPKLKDFESKKWWELENEKFGSKGKSKHHWVDVKQIIRPAQQRLVNLKLDDVQELFSIRLTGTQRVWGIRDYNYFKMLWFDFDHEIYPSNRD